MSALEVAEYALRETSRTFYLPIVRLPPGLREAVTSAYLCLRAIDEIEDHAHLNKTTKIKLLRRISEACRTRDVFELDCLSKEWNGLPDVTNRLGEWTSLAPKEVAPLIWGVNAEMSSSLADWVDLDWRIGTRAGLDRYTFCVAGTVGVLLSDLWEWHDGTQSDRAKAISFGRGLQAVNILRNRAEDLARGVDFFPTGWCEVDVKLYAEENLSLAAQYLQSLPFGAAREFCRIPLILAHATVEALGRGDQKLSRSRVLRLVGTETSAATLDSSTSTAKESGFSAPTPEMIILVDENDEFVGVEEKIRTHQLGIRHRAFSIFILNKDNELLLQKRARKKYHSKGQWSNTCCGHPRLGESVERAGHRRLQEEMGFDCEMREVFAFSYRAELENNLIENEYDHVLIGEFDGQPNPNLDEVDDWKWVSLRAAQSDALAQPQEYTRWFTIAISMLSEKLM